MTYNKIHKRFELGLGLYFTLDHCHAEYPGKFLVKSNIPAIDMLVLTAKDTVEAIKEVHDKIYHVLKTAHYEDLDFTQIKKYKL